MRKCIVIFFFVVLVSVIIAPSAYAREMNGKEFAAYCRKLQRSIDIIWNSGKSLETRCSALLTILEKTDPNFKITDKNGNFVTFNWNDDLESLNSALEESDPDKDEINDALARLQSRIKNDIKVVGEIDQSSTPVTKDKVKKAIKGTLKDPMTVVQPGKTTPNLLSEELNEGASSFFSRILEKIFDGIKWIDDKLGGGKLFSNIEGAEGLNWLVVVLVILVLAFFFVNMFRLVSLNQRLGNNPEETGVGSITISLSLALDKAEKYISAGDYLSALKELLRGFFMGLDEMNLIPYRTSRTNREYRYAIPQLASSYAPFARDFLPFMDDVLYGGHQVVEEDYMKYKKALESAFKH